MAMVNIKVTQPDEQVAELYVYESANPTGPFVQIGDPFPVVAGMTLNEVDVDATLATDWFAVQWMDEAGAWVAPLSPPIKAGGESFVQTVVDRVMQRDMSLNADVVRQEAEAAIESYFNKNPYGVTLADISDGQQYRIINGLTYLAMARGYIVASSSNSSVESATLGLVSFRSESGSTKNVDVAALIELANLALGMNTSLVMQMADIEDCTYWWQINVP